MSEIGTIYVFHFSKPYRHARHYIGWTRNLKYRWMHHRNGNGSPLLKAVMQDGGEPILVKKLTGDRNLERKIKNLKNPRNFCPVCKKGKPMGEYLSVKRTTYSGNKTCKWCGQTKRRMFLYDGTGPFCNKDCCSSYNMGWPSSIFGPLPVEYVND